MYQAAKDELSDRIRSAKREARTTFNDINGAIDRIRSLEQAVEAQELVVKTRQVGFPHLYSTVEVLDAERDLFIAKRDLLQVRYDYTLASLKLKYVTGSLAEKDVWLIDQWLVGHREEAVYKPLIEDATTNRNTNRK